MKKYFFSLFLLVVAVFILIKCKNNDERKIAVTGITLNKNVITFECLGHTEKLIATVEPSDATNKDVIWTSNNESVATVGEDGTVTARGVGATTIYVATDNRNFVAQCNVNVLQPHLDCIPVTGVRLDKTELTINVDQRVTLTHIIEPDHATNKSVSWSSSKPLVANVNATTGEIRGTGIGECEITVKTVNGGHTASCKLTVIVSATGVTLSHKSMDLVLGRKNTLLSAFITPSNVINKKVTWSSDQPDIAEVDQNGDIHAKALGTAVIKAKTDDGGFEASCNVRVKASPYRQIKGFLRTDGKGNYIDDEGIVAIQGMGNILSQQDFPKAASIGFNNVRFYMDARNFMSNETYNWNTLNNAVSWAKQNNLTLVLCLMERPGTNNPEFMTNPSYQNRHVDFWKSVANRYKDEPAISAYEIMNEPPINPVDGEGYPFTKTFGLYQTIVQRLVTEIREIDMNHNIIIEHPWLAGAQEPNLGMYNTQPNDQRDNWRNVNGKFNYPDIEDPANNYSYTYHCYEPGRYVHQIPQEIQTQFNCSSTVCDCHRVYPSNTIAKHSVMDPVTGQSWTMNERFVEYSYTICMDYIRNVKKVPAYVGEWGVMSCNFTNNNSGVNRGARQYILDVVSALAAHELSWSYHPFYRNEFSPNVDKNWERTMKEAFGTE